MVSAALAISFSQSGVIDSTNMRIEVAFMRSSTGGGALVTSGADVVFLENARTSGLVTTLSRGRTRRAEIFGVSVD